MHLGLAHPADLNMPTPSVLWMDDQPEFLRGLGRILTRSGMPLSIDSAASIDEAETKLHERQYSAFVADCRMSNFDPAGENGAEFLLKVNHTFPVLPTFVCSAYLFEPVYEGRLHESNAIFLAEKTRELDAAQIKKDRFFTELYSSARSFDEVKDLKPELIRYSDYLAMPDRFTSEVNCHWQRHGTWISKELIRRGHLWCVVCGEEIVHSSDDLFDYPDETVLDQIGRDCKLIPFAYGTPLPPEQNIPGPEWTPTKYPKDFYPCIKLRLTDIVSDDFDTGAFQTHVSDELVQLGVLDHVRGNNSTHLGQDYRLVTKKIKVCLVAEDGTERAADLTVCVVKDWRNSPFVDVNGRRKILIGRDIFRAFNVEIALNSQSRRSSIRFLD
jgi:CheY-like chemotaxis protein